MQNPPNVKPEASKPGYVLLPGCQRVSGDLFMQEETRSSKTPVHFTSCKSAWSCEPGHCELRYQEKGVGVNNAVLEFLQPKERKLALAVDNVTRVCVILNVMTSILVFCMKTTSET